MTREKAIEILKEIIDEGWLISDFEKCVAIDACEMAIEALEQEPCEDCVSRQVVMEYIKNCTIDLGYENGTNMVLDVISNMPSIQPKTDVLDKIRAEIEEIKPNNPKFKGYFEQNVALNKVLQIIDKYRTESKND